MSISFDENEQILFKGKATYNSKNGEIVVTSLRFAWVSSGIGDQEFHTAWANITNIKYSPADDPKERVMAMIQMVAGSSTEKPPVFHLTGPTKQGCRMELERLKTVVANVRKGKPPEHLDSKGPKVANSGESTPATQIREKKRSRTQMTVDKNSAEYGDSLALIEKRRELLVADKLLGKQYKELVEVSKLLTPEDFWDNYGSQHQQFLPESKRKGTSCDTKGMLSVMLMDVEGTKNADGSRRIDLTKEKRDQIFQMYPAVRKAFEAEVPLNKTETDFWVAYFQSEFFARDKGGRATAGDDDAFGRTDDMFSRYEERLGESNDRRSAPSSSSGSALGKVCKKNLAGLVGSDVDLTAILGDFGPADASNLEAGSGLSKNKAIVDKYNKFSQMFMKGKVLSQGVEGDSRKSRRATELSELNKEPEPAYLPLHLGHTGGALEPVKEEEEGVSAFAKSAFAVKKSALPAAPPQAAMTSEKLLSGLLSAFPSPQRAMSCFLADLTSLDALSVVAQRAAVSAGESVGPKAVVGQQTYEAPPSNSDVAGLSGGIRAAGPRAIKAAPGPVVPAVLDLTGASSTLSQGAGIGASTGGGTEADPPGPTAPEGSELGDAFRQEMTEQFTLVTEFSRHFYAMLNRDGVHAPLPNTTAAEKVIKIVGRLREYGENLSRKKKNLLAQDRDNSGISTQKRVSSCIAVISEILKLIARVNMKWEAYQKSSAGIHHQ